MNELIVNQISTLVIFFITGICIGVFFDFFRIQRKVFKINDIITCIQDILFWIISGIILIFVIVRYTDGVLRLYMIFGLILGVFLYFLSISKYFIKVSTFILGCVLRIMEILISPLKKIIKIIKKGWKKNKNMI